MKLKAFFRACWNLVISHWFGLSFMLLIIISGVLGVKFKITYILCENVAGNTIFPDFIFGVSFFLLALTVLALLLLLTFDMIIPIIIQIKDEITSNYQSELASLQSKKKNHK